MDNSLVSRWRLDVDDAKDGGGKNPEKFVARQEVEREQRRWIQAENVGCEELGNTGWKGSYPVEGEDTQWIQQ